MIAGLYFAFRMDAIGAFLVFAGAVFSIILRRSLSPGLVGR